MNPLTKVKLINELNEREAALGIQDKVSWHSEYKDSAWVFLGGLPYELTEGDVICVFSQYGEIVNINLVRDKKTGKSKGFCFLCYEDQRSTILAVDNLNGIKIKGRTIRVDHVANYRPPKDDDDIDSVTKTLRWEGCAPKAPLSASASSESSDEITAEVPTKKRKKEKKKKKKKEKKEKKIKEEQSSKHVAKTRNQSQSASPPVRIKRECEDAGYEKYANTNRESQGDCSNDQRGTTTDRKHSAEADEMRNRGKYNERNQSRNFEREERRRNDQTGRGTCNETSGRDSRCNYSDGTEARHDEERQSYQREKIRREERFDTKYDNRDKYRKNDRNKREERDSDSESAKSKDRRNKHNNGSHYKERDDHRDRS